MYQPPSSRLTVNSPTDSVLLNFSTPGVSRDWLCRSQLASPCSLSEAVHHRDNTWEVNTEVETLHRNKGRGDGEKVNAYE